MQDINIGLIGAGYMGKAHTIAYKAVRSIFPTVLNPVCECIGTSSEAGAARSARELGWHRSTGDWRALVNDPAIDAIIVATPPATHKDIVLAALALGKPVFCEKPLGMSAAESLQLAQAAEAAGVANMVGYN
ncbi:Gfo/Idh/MocA family oxidoreductase [Janthinobacterium sp. 78]|uniref:Gfo/Idh/MocA family protein n=1 Tax=Janthinobacterium sp. 78 TaxID=2135631 RepID=UPI000D5D66EB|nr:Gfo/Idh/MocA family oxidoreductase [Janthinobacterium sp. 78]PVX36682.1 oxidoreductase family protein [Janthinobacterium sp. 78]